MKIPFGSNPSFLMIKIMAQFLEINDVKIDLLTEFFRIIYRYLRISDFSDDSGVNLMDRIQRIVAQDPPSLSDLTHAFSQSQALSKKWLVDETARLNLDLKVVFLCAGWYGTLFLNPKLKFSYARSFDIDPSCAPIADELNRALVMDNWKFKAITQDIQELNFSKHSYTAQRKNGTSCDLEDSPDTIINTSCEHIEKFDAWYSKIPTGKLIILQSNDGFDIPGHVNCSKDLNHFSEKTPLSQVLYSGEKKMPKFNRFMRIGYR